MIRTSGWTFAILVCEGVLATMTLTAGRPLSAWQEHARAADIQGERLAPFLQTPMYIVERMLAMAEVTSDDLVYDLGCGDGRIVIAAAQKYGARGLGIDFDPARVAESRENARKAGVERLVSFRVQDALTVDVSDATVVMLYLGRESNLKLRPILTRELKPGARIVSHDYGMGDWPPLEHEHFEEPGDPGITRDIFLWKADGIVRP